MKDDWEYVKPRSPPRKKRSPAQERAIEHKKRERRQASKVGEAVYNLLQERKRTMAKKKTDKKSGGKGAAKKEDLFADVKMGAEGEDGFAPVYDPEGGEVFEFKDEGDEVEGIFFDHFVYEGENDEGTYETNCYKLFDVDNEKTWLVWGSFVLDKHMTGIKPGTYIRITYKGKAGRAHNFRLGVSKGYTKDYAKVAKELLEKVAAIKEGNKDVPF
jgi:hypothetical protein